MIANKIYKTKNDIPYTKLLKFGEAIKGSETDIELITKKVNEIFQTSDVLNFEKALFTNPKKIKFKYKVDTDLTKISKFIDADTFQKENDIEALLQLFVKPKNIFQKIDINQISYAEAEYIINSFL
jgi:hypothetical protein